MDEQLARLVRERGGLLLPADVARLSAAQRRGLLRLQPGVHIASTQPVTPETVVAALQASVDDYTFAGRTALWVYEVVPLALPIDVAVPATRQIVLLPPARVRRLAPSLLAGSRHMQGHHVVSLEVAVVQSAAELPEPELLALVEHVLRKRLTTVPRLTTVCRRGVQGASRLRGALDVVRDGDLEHLKRKVRKALTAAGVTGLESELPLRSRSGAIAYLDLVHRATGNAFEIDGWASHTERERFVADRRRDRWVRREHGLTTTRIAADEVRASLSAVVEELLPMLQVGGRRDGHPPAA